jgi:hypothetical protein
VVVLMTDGENTNQYDVRQPYKSGFSPIFYHATDDRYSVHVASRDDSEDYWISIGEAERIQRLLVGRTLQQRRRGVGGAELALSLGLLHRPLHRRPLPQVPANQSGDWNLYNRIRSNGDELYAGRTQADNNLRDICDAANAQNILVFAIGFEAPAGGQAVMQYCASSDAHYYDVDGIEISDAFASIARTINSLRLIQ